MDFESLSRDRLVERAPQLVAGGVVSEVAGRAGVAAGLQLEVGAEHITLPKRASSCERKRSWIEVHRVELSTTERRL